MNEAKRVTLALGGHWLGDGGTACCPAHDDRTPSLSISRAYDGKVLVHCHAGCEQARVIAALRAQGYWTGPGNQWLPDPRSRTVSQRRSDCDSEPSAAALDIWNRSGPAEGSPVETYLRWRGVLLTPPPPIRFRAALKHNSGGVWPTMVALVTRGPEATPVGIHRTFLARDGAGKAPVASPKMMLGPCGGGAVRLADDDGPLVVAEGIETALSVLGGLGPGFRVWATLGVSGMKKLVLPAPGAGGSRELVIASDGDDAGRTAANTLAARANAEGWSVGLMPAPEGLDWNDVVKAEASRRAAA